MLAEKYFVARVKYLKPAMDQSVEEVLNEVKGRIPSVTGSTRASMHSMVIQGTGSTVGKVTTSMRRPDLSPFILNYGRGAGKRQPPGGKLVWWVVAKGLAGYKDAAQVAFVIARSIAKKGTKGLRFQYGSMEDKKQRIIAIHETAVENIVKDMEK